MSIIDYYKSALKVVYKNYKINDYHSTLVLEGLEQLEEIFRKNCINFLITGSISHLFHYKKIYRTIKDIDIFINDKDLIKILSLLKNSFDIYHQTNTTVPKQIENFKFKQDNYIKLKSIKLKYGLDLINYNDLGSSRKIFIANFDKTTYHYVLPDRSIDSIWNRPKDLNDKKIFNIL